MRQVLFTENEVFYLEKKIKNASIVDPLTNESGPETEDAVSVLFKTGIVTDFSQDHDLYLIRYDKIDENIKSDFIDDLSENIFEKIQGELSLPKNLQMSKDGVVLQFSVAEYYHDKYPFLKSPIKKEIPVSPSVRKILQSVSSNMEDIKINQDCYIWLAFDSIGARIVFSISGLEMSLSKKSAAKIIKAISFMRE